MYYKQNRKLIDNDFAAKWSCDIARYGFTMVPNTMLIFYKELALSPVEFLLLINIESYRWDADALPFPTVETLGARLGITPRTVTRIVTRLCKKRLIDRFPFRNTSNRYCLDKLTTKMNVLIAHAEKQPEMMPKKLKMSGVDDKYSCSIETLMSYKEDSIKHKNKTHLGNYMVGLLDQTKTPFQHRVSEGNNNDLY